MALDSDLIAAALPAYEMGEELGRGAWGIVLAGRHRHLGREVAIKQLPRAFGADPDVRARFVAEARLLASLDHPHVVPVFDFVEYQGLCLLVMERLTGGTLSSRMHGERIDPEKACAVLLAACAGIHYAHQRGVLHRDIKPENLMFSSQGVLKVTDFGLAKVVGGSLTLATRAGEVLGTPAYMAPEQAQAGELGPHTDVYAIGLVLYELLAGQLPFAETSDPVSTLYRHVHEQPRPLLELAPGIPPAVAEATMQAIRRDPMARFPSASAFGVALAGAATRSWGREWLERSGTEVVAAGPILAAVHGERRVSSPTLADPIPAIAPADDSVPNIAGLVPVSIGADPPGASGDSPAEVAPRPVDLAPPPPAPAAPPPSDPPAAAARRPGSKSARHPAVLAGVAVLLVALIVAAVLAKSGGDGGDAAAPVTTVPPDITVTTGVVGSAWQAVRDAPTARQQVAATAADGVVWLLGGLTGDGATAKVEGYDPVVDAWRAGPDLPVPIHHATAVTYKGEIVVIGGWVPEGANLTATTSNRAFALRGGAWVELPPMHHARSAGAAAVAGDKIVVAGGQAAGALVGATEIFDGAAWHDAAPIPTPREHLAAASDGRYAYVVGGRDLSADKNVPTLERYDPAADEWQSLPDMPTARGGVGAAIAGGRLVVAGGEQPTAASDVVETYDLGRATWSPAPSLSTPRHGLALVAVGNSVYAIAGAQRPGHQNSTAAAESLSVSLASPPPTAAPVSASDWQSLKDAPLARQQTAATEKDGTVWVIGGLTDAGASSKVQGYDPVIDGWKEGPELPIPLHHAAAVTYRDEIVVMGGWTPNGANVSGTVSDRVFALRQGKWVELPHLNRPRAAGAAAVADDRIVLTGGQAGGTLIGPTEVFDGASWADRADLPTPREHLAASSDGELVYVIGGRELSSDKNVASLEAYDPATDRWIVLGDMPTARGGLAAAIAAGQLIVVGGEEPATVDGDVEAFDLTNGTWSTLSPFPTPRHGLSLVAVGTTVYAVGGATTPGHRGSTAALTALSLG